MSRKRKTQKIQAVKKSSVELIVAKCPMCGGKLNITPNDGIMECSFCNSYIIIQRKDNPKNVVSSKEEIINNTQQNREVHEIIDTKPSRIGNIFGGLFIGLIGVLPIVAGINAFRMENYDILDSIAKKVGGIICEVIGGGFELVAFLKIFLNFSLDYDENEYNQEESMKKIK